MCTAGAKEIKEDRSKKKTQEVTEKGKKGLGMNCKKKEGGDRFFVF